MDNEEYKKALKAPIMSTEKAKASVAAWHTKEGLPEVTPPSHAEVKKSLENSVKLQKIDELRKYRQMKPEEKQAVRDKALQQTGNYENPESKYQGEKWYKPAKGQAVKPITWVDKIGNNDKGLDDEQE